MRGWLERDLQGAQDKRWRFALFHHPAVHSSQVNDGQQQVQMRLISDLLERYGVAIAFAGHYHNYQRSHPVKFVADAAARQAKAPPGGSPKHIAVPGRFVIDTRFDGKTHTQPNGVIHIVTGAGGAELYEPEYTDQPAAWQPYTSKFNGREHSFSVLDVDSDKLVLRQISVNGRELDQIVLTQLATMRDPQLVSKRPQPVMLEE